MGKYFFRYRCQTRLALDNWGRHQLSDRKKFEIYYRTEKCRIFIYDARIGNNPKMHYGLGFDVLIGGKDVKTAQYYAQILLEDIVASLSFLYSCYVSTPEIIIQYEMPGKNNILENWMSYVLDKDEQSRELSLRYIDIDKFLDFVKHLESINDQDELLKIKQSLHWYWKSLNTTDKRDRFILLWVAVEVIETVLKKRFGFESRAKKHPTCRECKNEVKNCPQCEATLMYSASTGFLGFKKVIEMSELKISFDANHNMRSKVLHGSGSYSPEDIDKAIHEITLMIARALFFLINIKVSISDNFGKNARFQTVPLRYRIWGKLKAKTIPTFGDIEKQPVVYGRYLYEFDIDKNRDEALYDIKIEEELSGEFELIKIYKTLSIDSSQSMKSIEEKNGK